MAVYDSLLGVATPSIPNTSKITKAILDKVYAESAVLLCDAATMLGSAVSVPVPLLGFTYETPERMTLLSYDYARYTYLNKAQISNAFIKNEGDASIVANRAITKNNSIVTNVALNEAFFTMLEKYCDKGGTFALLTMWGYYENFVLTSLETNRNAALGGVSWRMNFRRFNKVNSTLIQQYSETLQNVINGTL